MFLRSLTLDVAGFGRGPNPEANKILDFILDSMFERLCASRMYHNRNGKKKTSVHFKQNSGPHTARACGGGNLNFFSTQLMLPVTFQNFRIQLCPGRMCVSSFGDQGSRPWTHPHLSGLTFCRSLTTISATLVS